MSERPPGDGNEPNADDRFSWLYGSNPSADPDATQAIPRPSNPPPTPDSDRTQAIPQGGPPPGPPQPTRPERSDLPPMNMPPPGQTKTDEPPWQQPPPPVKPKKKRRWWLRIILALILIWILFLIAVPIWAWSKIDKVDAEPDGDRPSDQPGTTYLVVGSDSREGLSKEEGKELGTGGSQISEGSQRTDTIMLLHVGDGQPILLSIPRDSIVDIPGVGDDQKVNAAFSAGGPKLLVKTLENETDIRVDDYIEIGFGGFVNIVDAVGGIEVCPDQAIDDKKASLDIDKGCQEADGITALGYARTRDFGTGDIQRGQNQREVIGEIGDKAASPWSVLNPFRYWNVANSSADSLRIGENVGPLSLARFAWNMAHVTSGGGLSCTVPIADLAVNWDEDRSEELFDYIIEDNTDDIPKSLCTKDGLEH
ncbi:MAG TPA: LCP family protein [Nocardioidaceae bacterium]|nr:LCP family protein [Nocardioidaceae bacterium]